MSEDGLYDSGAYPETDLLVGQDGAAATCPYCDTVIALSKGHECYECGAKMHVTISWDRS